MELRTPPPLQRLLLLGLGIFLFLPQLFALDPSRSVFQYNYQSWTRVNGVPVNRIRAITQTTDGYLWVGTMTKLARFDGTDFQRVAIPNREGWRKEAINSLAPGARGGLWFGLDSGSFGYYDGKSEFTSFSGDWAMPQMDVRCIEETPDGTIWIASRNGIAAMKEGKTNVVFLNSDVGEMWSIYQDTKHRVWLGSLEKGLFYWESGKLNVFPDPQLIGQNICCITVDKEGQLWIGTQIGLRCYDSAFRRVELLTLSGEVRALLTDKHGVVWIGTTGNGLIRYFHGEISYLRKADGLASDSVSALCEDREGSLWVGTSDGFTQISDLKFPAPSITGGLLNEPVHGLCAAGNGGIWCATSTGVYNYNRKEVSRINTTPDMNPYFKRVLEAKDGDLYAISGGREILIMSAGKLVARHPNNEWMVAMTEDSQGVIVSVGAKLYRVSRTELTAFSFTETPPAFYWIRNLFTCKDDSLLVACVDGVFHIRDGRVEQHWSTPEGLSDKDVLWANEDDEGTIWVGLTSGLARIRNNKVTVIHNELSDTMISAIVPDSVGYLWISCAKGIIRANRRSMNDFADGITAKPDLRIYDGTESLGTIDQTEIEAVACRSLDGHIWLPGPLGAVEIDPAHVLANTVPPPVYIQRVVINGVERTNLAPTKVPPGKGDLLFQYVGLSFIAPQKIHFRHKLEGYDTDWIESGTQRTAVYSNLKPRKYTFHVQACNADGLWNTEGASYEVELPPAYYQTRWFQVLAGVAIALGLFGIYYWRVRHLRHEEKELQATNELLESRIRERTQELAEQHNLLRTLIDHLPDNVFVKDTHSRLVLSNQAHARFIGDQNPESVVGKTDFDFLPRDQAEKFLADEQALLNSGLPFNGEESITNQSTGEQRWSRTTKVPLRDRDGRIIGLAGIHRDITERKQWETRLESLHRQLVEASRQAGMAEIATSVLHNVGNVLNSVNVSASILSERVKTSAATNFERVTLLLQENQHDLPGFLTQDKKGRQLVPYLESLVKRVAAEKSEVVEELECLVRNVQHIKGIVAMQQSHARVVGVHEILDPAEFVGDAIRMQEDGFVRHAIKLRREFSPVEKITVDRHMVIQILVNLLQNAKRACEENSGAAGEIIVRLGPAGLNRIQIEVEDNGVGIPSDNLTHIFSHGFTTRKNGHGFGLHSGAIAAKQMGGSLSVHSAGPGLGARFTLELPCQPNSNPNPDPTGQERTFPGNSKTQRLADVPV